MEGKSNTRVAYVRVYMSRNRILTSTFYLVPRLVNNKILLKNCEKSQNVY